MTTATTTAIPTIAPTVEVLRTELEDVWANLDAIFDSLSTADWTRKHGKDWTMADVPFHLAYFDREIVAIPLERHSGEAPAGQHVQRTLGELNAWNATEFAKRPTTQTALDSLRAWRATRDRIRALLARMADADLEGEAWCFLAGMGTRSVGAMLGALISHSWSHLAQLRYYLKRSDAAPSDAVLRRALHFYSHMMALSFMPERSEALGRVFVAGLEITGPGGGAWAIRAEGRRCTVTAVAARELAQADVCLTMTPDTFIKMFAEISSPMWLMLTRQIRVRGLRGMPTFGKLFPPFDLGREVLQEQVSF